MENYLIIPQFFWHKLFFVILLVSGFVFFEAQYPQLPDSTEDSPNSLLEKPFSSSAVILQYHHIANNTPPITSTKIELFKQHLDYLSKNNFVVWPLEKLISKLKSKSMIPENVVSITFDDAYDNIYTQAWPLLMEKRYPFTLFVSTDLIGTPGYIDWDQIREMSTAGLSVANHTQSHPHLIRRIEDETELMWNKRISEEITGAEKIILKELPDAPLLKFLAYPYGEYNRDLVSILDTLGYIGFGQQSGAAGHNSNSLYYPRFPLSGVYANFSTFVTKVQTLSMPLLPNTFLDPELKQGDTKPQFELRFDNSNYRLHQLACYGPGEEMILKRIAPTIFLVQSKSELPVGRSRYNCTMPVKVTPADKVKPNNTIGSNRFYWFSQLWIRKHNDGSWYAEP